MVRKEVITEFRKTSERISIEMNVKIEDVIKLECDNKINSSIFCLLNQEWYLQIRGEEEFGLGIYLCRKKCNDDTSIWCSLQVKILNKQIKDESGDYFYKKDCDYQNILYLDISERSDFFDKLCVLTILCTVSDSETKSGSILGANLPSLQGTAKLSKELEEFFVSEHLADVTLKVKDQEFRVHTFILAARCPVFLKIFQQDMLEKGSGSVEISDCDPSCFRHFLYFLYTGKCDFSANEAIALYRICDKYDIQELKEKCVVVISNNVSIDTLFEVAQLATLCNESEMLQKAIAFFIANAKTITHNYAEKWIAFMKENSRLANEFLKPMVRKIDKSNRGQKK